MFDQIAANIVREIEEMRRENERLRKARVEEAELLDLKRWKSTHAPRLAALEELLRAAQAEAEAGREAIATLASERAANALLTEETERLRARVALLKSYLVRYRDQFPLGGEEVLIALGRPQAGGSLLKVPGVDEAGIAVEIPRKLLS